MIRIGCSQPGCAGLLFVYTGKLIARTYINVSEPSLTDFGSAPESLKKLSIRLLTSDVRLDRQ